MKHFDGDPSPHLYDRPARVVDWPPPRRPRQNRGGLIVLAALAADRVRRRDGAVVLRRVAVVRLPRLRRCVLEDAERAGARCSSASRLSPSSCCTARISRSSRARLGELTGVPILINGQPIQLPVEPVLRLIALGGSLAIAVVTGAGMMANWQTLALYWYSRSARPPPRRRCSIRSSGGRSTSICSPFRRGRSSPDGC